MKNEKQCARVHPADTANGERPACHQHYRRRADSFKDEKLKYTRNEKGKRKNT